MEGAYNLAQSSAVLTLAARTLKLQQYREHLHGACERMTEVSRDFTEKNNEGRETRV